MTKKFSERDPTDEILRAFKLFDEDNNGEYKMFIVRLDEPNMAGNLRIIKVRNIN